MTESGTTIGLCSRALLWPLCLAVVLGMFSNSLKAAIFTVDSTTDAVDASPGNGVCATSGAVCTLRAAIQESNALAGADTVAFNIAGAGPHTIQPTSALPSISDPVIIDGTTEPDFTGTPIIELNGALAGARLIVTDIEGRESGPVRFRQGRTSSGLTYSFLGLGSTSDDLLFSNDGGATFGYTPKPGRDGTDPEVAHVKVNPKGVFAPKSDPRLPSFQLNFRLRLPLRR